MVDVHQVVRDKAGAVLASEHVGHRFTLEHSLIQAMEVCPAPNPALKNFKLKIKLKPKKPRQNQRRFDEAFGVTRTDTERNDLLSQQVQELEKDIREGFWTDDEARGVRGVRLKATIKGI